MDKRIFKIDPPEATEEMVEQIPKVHDGPHLELFYNLIFSEMNWTLPDHLRPVVWALADKTIPNMMIIFSPGAGKSQLVDIAFPLFELGHDPNLTIMGVSSGADLMIDFLQAAMTTMDDNQIYKLLFPNVIPDKNKGWSTTRGAFIKRTVTGQASPSYAATGYGAKSITGKHAKLLLVDDIHDMENSSTPDQINKVETFYYQTLIGRGDPQGYRMIMVGRRWDIDDLYGRLLKSGDWFVMTLASIRDTKELYYDVRIPAGLSCIFNNYQSKPEVEDIKVVFGENEEQLGFYWKGMLAKYTEALVNKKNKPAIFETVYQSNPESIGTRIFRKDDFRDFFIPEEMYMGRNYDTVANFLDQMGFELLLQSWDTAYTAESENDPSCCYTIGLKGCVKNHRSQDPNPDEVPFHYDLYLLDEWYNRLEYGELKQEAINYHNIWRPNYVLVENSVAGIPLIQSLQSDSIQVIGIIVQHTNKRSRAINGAKAGSAQGWSRQGNILVPRKTTNGNDVQWAMPLLDELVDFTGAKGKRDDRVDALIQAANFAIDLGVQSRDLPPGWREQSDIDARLLSWMQPQHPLTRLIISQMGDVRNPLYGLCGSCRHYDEGKSYCNLHKMGMTKLSSCPLYSPSSKIEPTLRIENGRIIESTNKP